MAAPDWGLLLEAERRGILPKEKSALLAEARARGLVPNKQPGPEDIPPTELPIARNPFASDTRFDPEISAFDYNVDRFKKGAAGFFSLAALPSEVLNLPGAGLRAAGVPIGFPLGSIMGETRKGFEKAFGVRDLKPPSKGQEIVGSIAEFAGGGIAPSSAVVARAPRKIAALIPEVTSTVFGGVGSQLGADVGGAPGQMAGGIAGGVAGVTIPATLFGKLIPFLEGKRLSLSAKERLAGKELESAMRSEPEAGINLVQSEKTARDIEGIGLAPFEPRLSQRTGAEGVAKIERSVIGKSAERVGEAVATERANVRAIESAVERGIGPSAPKAIQSAASRALAQATTRLDQQIDGILDQEKALAKSLPSNQSKNVGERLVALRAYAKGVADDVVNGLKKNMYDTAARMGVKEDMSDLVTTVRTIGGTDENIFQNMPPVFGDVIRTFSAKGKVVAPGLVDAAGNPIRGAQPLRIGRDASFEEMHSLYKRVNEEYYTAKHTGDRQEMRYLGQLKDVLSEKMKKFGSQEFGELAEQFNIFNKFYREKYIPAFVEGTGGRIGATNRFGELVKPEDVARRYFTPSGVDDFRATFTDPTTGKPYPAAYEAFQDGVLTMFEKQAVVNGVIDVSRVASFMRQHAETLSYLPKLKETLMNTLATQEAMVARNARFEAAKSALGDSHLAKLAGAEDLEAYIAKAVTDPKELSRIMAIPNPESRRAALRAFADNLAIISTRYGVDPYTYIVQNEKTLKPLFDKVGPNHFKNIKTIASAKTIMARGEIPDVSAATTARMDPLVEKIGTERSSMINMLRMVLVTKSAQPTSMITILTARFLNKMRGERMDEALYAAIRDPETAKRLLETANAPESKVAMNLFTNHLASIGIRATSVKPQEREDRR